ncbi:MAG: transglycosylase SLT domain-containing protein [Anaerovoracaceae bacterium]|jgi:hypothetical protein|nr:transglycosylase SLT domain-containing protein [Anaerovoracaceae bacterium]
MQTKKKRDTGTDMKANTDTDTGTDMKANTDTDTGTDMKANTDTDTGTDMKANTNTDTGTDMKENTNTVPETKKSTKLGADTKTSKKNIAKKTLVLTLRMGLVLLAVLVVVMLTANSVGPQEQENLLIEDGTRFYVRDININGTKIVNYYLNNPFFIYLDSAYVPVSEALGDILGFDYKVSREEPYIFISKKIPVREQLEVQEVKRGDESIRVTERYDVQVFHGIPKEKLDPKGLGGMSLLGLPALQGDDGVFYLPIKALMEDPVFQWDVYADPNYGLCISTLPDITALSLWSEKESKFNQGLAEYIRSRNPNIRPSVAQEYTFYFKNAARENAIEVEWLMALSQCESRFRKDVVSHAGATGMMQIMEATGRGYGLSKDDLLDPKKNIDFGAMYYAQMLDGYKGDQIRALSAYQMGIPNENKGGYEPIYANTIMWAHDNLKKFLRENGYVY